MSSGWKRRITVENTRPLLQHWREGSWLERHTRHCFDYGLRVQGGCSRQSSLRISGRSIRDLFKDVAEYSTTSKMCQSSTIYTLYRINLSLRQLRQTRHIAPLGLGRGTSSKETKETIPFYRMIVSGIGC